MNALREQKGKFLNNFTWPACIIIRIYIFNFHYECISFSWYFFPFLQLFKTHIKFLLLLTMTRSSVDWIKSHVISKELFFVKKAHLQLTFPPTLLFDIRRCMKCARMCCKVSLTHKIMSRLLFIKKWLRYLSFVVTPKALCQITWWWKKNSRQYNELRETRRFFFSCCAKKNSHGNLS